MTGFITLGSTYNSGLWFFQVDAGVTGKTWNIISWNGATPVGSYINVRVRASNKVLELPGTYDTQTGRLVPRAYTPVVSGQPFSGVTGRFLEVRITLARDTLSSATPTLTDLTVNCPN